MLATKPKYPRKIKPRCHCERRRLAECRNVYQLYRADFYRVPGGMGLRRPRGCLYGGRYHRGDRLRLVRDHELGIQRFGGRSIWDVMNNWVLVALPMFILMGIMLEKSGLAGRLLENLATLLERVPGGLAISVTTIGVLLAASTGIIGASVVLCTFGAAEHAPAGLPGRICDRDRRCLGTWAY